MKFKLTILNIAGLVQIVVAIANYLIYGKKGDEEGWGLLATIILAAFGIGVILLDWLLQSVIRNPKALLFIEVIVIAICWFIIYKSDSLSINIGIA